VLVMTKDAVSVRIETRARGGLARALATGWRREHRSSHCTRSSGRVGRGGRGSLTRLQQNSAKERLFGDVDCLAMPNSGEKALSEDLTRKKRQQ
jgi:hypothetical protein